MIQFASTSMMLAKTASFLLVEGDTAVQLYSLIVQFFLDGRVWLVFLCLFQPLVDSVDPAWYIFFSPVVSLTLPWVPSSAAEAIGKPLEDLNGLTCLGWQEMQTTSQLMQSLHDSCKLL